MANCNWQYNQLISDNENNGCWCYGCQPYPCPPVPSTPTIPTIQFRSSYLEAVGSGQTVATGANFAFDSAEDYVDIVGSDITISNSGTTFTLKRPGLYHVEWSLNLNGAILPIMVGLMQNGEPDSVIASSVTTGSMSSGALIKVSAADAPCVLTLHNFGSTVTISDSTVGNTAASIRILRFADGPN